VHNSTPPTPPSGEQAREQAEDTRDRMGLAEKLNGLKHAAQLMVMNGWTPERAVLDPEEEWSAGEVVATACTEGGETMVYSLHLDPNGENWWHSVEMIFTQVQRWVKAPVDSIAVDEAAEEMLADRQQARNMADTEYWRLLKEHVNHIV
jgi:hypothetical protein